MNKYSDHKIIFWVDDDTGLVVLLGATRNDKEEKQSWCMFCDKEFSESDKFEVMTYCPDSRDQHKWIMMQFCNDEHKAKYLELMTETIISHIAFHVLSDAYLDYAGYTGRRTWGHT